MFLSTVLVGEASLVLAQAVPITQTLSLPDQDFADFRHIPLYGNSIVNLPHAEPRLDVYDLEGALRFGVDYADGLAEPPRPGIPDFTFVGAADLLEPNTSELVFYFSDASGDRFIRKINERDEMIYTEVLDADFNVHGLPYFYTDPQTLNGFLALDFWGANQDSVLVYPLGDLEARRRLPGEIDDNYPVYPTIPLILNLGDTTFIGYDAALNEVARMHPRFGAESLTILGTDFGRDGILDAYSAIDTVIQGQEARRFVWYDNTGRIYLDTFVLDRPNSSGGYYALGILPSEGGFHTAQFIFGALEVTFRSDNGTLIDPNLFNPIFTQTVCYGGRDYLASVIPGWFVIDTLYNSRTGEAEIDVPAIILHDNQAAILHTVVGQCDAALPESVALVYDQASSQRILFTDEDATVRGALPYEDFAFAFRLDNNVYAFSDLDEQGNSAEAFYRIGEFISSAKVEQISLSLQIVPNPAHDVYYLIGLDGVADNIEYDVALFSVGGQQVAANQRVYAGEPIATPAAPGLYFVRMHNLATGHKLTSRLVVR